MPIDCRLLMICRNCGFSETSVDVNSVAEPQRQLADLYSEIARLQVQINELENKQTSFKREINARTPLFQLPPEVFSEIFAICLGKAGPQNPPDHCVSIATPLLFGRVCSTWRQIAWSTPKLWTSLLLELERSVDPALIHQWLVRSSNHLISIYATLRKLNPEPTSAILEIMHLISQHSERWQDISFQLPSFCYLALEGIQDRLPNLNYISIDSAAARLNLFSVAPFLRIVHVKADHLNGFILPLNQLTELSIDSHDAVESLDMLRRSPDVVTCSIRGWFEGNIGLHQNPTRILADKLESLHLEFQLEFIDPMSDVFDSLTLPAIRNLSCAGVEHPFPYSSFVSLIFRSSCSLRTLSLTALYVSDVEFAECLQALPLLNKLTLTKVQVTSRLLYMLKPCYSSNANASCLLPSLDTFECLGLLDLDFSVLASLLQSRWNIRQTLNTLDAPYRIARLQSVKFGVTRVSAPKTSTLVLLRNLLEEGMEISLVTGAGTWL